MHVAILVFAIAALRAPSEGALRASIACQHQHCARHHGFLVLAHPVSSVLLRACSGPVQGQVLKSHEG